MSGIRWEGHSHEDIYAAVHRGPGQAISAEAERVWTETEKLIQRIDQRIQAAMRESASGWGGSAAEQARTAMTPLGQWALDAANDAKITAQAVGMQGEQAGELRVAMPAPRTKDRNDELLKAQTDPLYIFHGLDDLHAVEHDAANRAARAVELMNTYTNNSYENRRNMDYWTFPPQVTVVTGPAGAADGAGAAVPPIGVGAAAAVPAGPAAIDAVPAPGSGPVGSPAAIPTSPGPAGGPGAALTGTGPAGGSLAPVPAAVPGVTPGRNAPVVAPGAAARPTTTPGTTPGTAPRSDSGAPIAVPGMPGSPSAVRPGAPGQPGPVGIRPVVPAPPPKGGPLPSWRDVVPGERTGRVPAAGGDLGGDRVVPPLGGGRVAPEGPGRSAPFAEPPVAGAADPAARNGTPRPGTAGPAAGLYPPLAAGTAAGQDTERRRADYLLDDSDAFADDRWFPPPVITPDDSPPIRH